MNSRKQIQDELKELNSLLPLDKGSEIFSIPQGYFEGFAASVLQKIKEGQDVSVADELTSVSPFLSGLSKEMPFTVPKGYFFQTTEGLLELVKEDVLPDFLQTDKKMPYAIPQGYFENLHEIILRKVNPKQAKVISINTSRKWMRYAVAAMMAGVIAVSSILYFGNKSIDPSAQSHEWVTKKLKNVPDKELDEFINTTDVSSTAMAKTEASNKTELRKILKDIPDTELDKFLDEVPFDNEESSLIN